MTRVLVIDDEPVVRGLMVEILERAGYEVDPAANAAGALELLEGSDASLVISDIVMPNLSGLELLEEVHRRRPSLPVLLVTGAGTYDNLSAALARGAAGLVMKPFSHAELLDAAHEAIERARRAEQELRERLLTPTLASALANAIEVREASTHGHCERMSALAVRLGELLGLGADELETLRLGAILHDVGKIGVPDAILLKPGPLDQEETAFMQTHPLIGDRLLEPLSVLEGVRPAVRHHHERWDGTGYPDRLGGEEIPLVARIVAVADAIEAMTDERPYRAPLEPHTVLQELRQGAGSQWDPEIVEAAFGLLRDNELSLGPLGLELRPPPVNGGPTHPILLVEGDPSYALLATAALEAAGNVTVAHATGIAAAERLSRHASWSLAVVDHLLPDGDGFRVLEALRDADPRLPVVILTARGEDVAVEAFRRGAADFVVKSPSFGSDLEARVRPLLE